VSTNKKEKSEGLLLLLTQRVLQNACMRQLLCRDLGWDLHSGIGEGVPQCPTVHIEGAGVTLTMTTMGQQG